MRKPTGYKNYSASEEGEIYSDRRNRKLTKTKIGGYHYVTLNVDKRTFSKTVHKLMALAFLDNPENKKTVNHKDGDGFNNKLSNLEWMTHKEQMEHAVANDLIKYHVRGVCQYSMDYKYIATFKSLKEAGEKTGVARRLICGVCQGRTFSAGGFRWKYEDDPEDFKYSTRGAAVHPVQQIDPETEEVINTFDNIKEASAATGASSTHIGSVCRGQRNSCGGFIWRYVIKEPEEEPEPPFYENWKYLPGYENYRVSEEGKIYSIRYKNFMKLSPYKDGYCYVDMGPKRISVHRLVAILYIPNPDNLPEVNHIDGEDKTNNSVSNLEWTTHSGNILHAYRTGLVKSRAKKIRQLSDKGKLIKIHDSSQKAAEEVGVTKEAIYAACAGRVKLCRGFKFEYVV